MTSKLRQRYAPVDIQAHHDGSIWPASIPPLTAPEAVRAARRLYRFAMGSTFRGPVVITSGNRFNDIRRGKFYVNPGRGWLNFVHELSHDFVYLANSNERPHSKFHARFEAKLAREVVRRGWLDGKLRDKPAAAIAPAKPGLDDVRRTKLLRIEQAMVRWERKQARATKALAKLARRQRYYAKALGVA